jgi:hypothetical protein
MSDQAFEHSSTQGAENRRKTGRSTRAARLAEIGKRTRFKPGQKSPNPKGRPRTAKFSEAVRQIAAEVNPKTGETNAQELARHTFRRAIAGSVRHQELLLNYGEGRPMQGLEISGPGGSSIGIANMTEAEIDARLAELLGSMTDAQLLARAARVFPVPATAIDSSEIDNSTVAECVEIIPAATAPAPAPADVTMAKTQTPVLTARQAKPLSDAARDQAYFLYTTGTIVAGASN